jgi:hypothetical protein
VEEAVKWRVFNRTLHEARAGFADLAPEAAEALLTDALEAVRREAAGDPG